ncbi:MAG: cardiolipin synthase [Shewanella sp.]|nr:cardiolipin synthase [Shewanella sp.]MCF1430068.1 cardiolipin synthase [Shewanella sp.]MCF1438980.1 cardiolipin synthase [Shewanella sp.]MCF1456362.1 cardiolipin synthase [Shewanella sp.]
MEKVVHLLTLAGISLYWMTTAAITLRIITKRRAIGVSLAWMMVIFVVPVGGVVAYLMFGELNLGRHRAAQARAMFEPYSQWFKRLHQWRPYQPASLSRYSAAITALCEQRMGIPALADNQLVLLSTTDSIFSSLIRDIEAATDSIHIEFYIWHPGGWADKAAAALIEAARRNVTIHILLDSAGSRTFFNSHWPQTLAAEGIRVFAALPVSPFRILFQRIDLRLHRKIVVIDNQIAYTGSMNLVDPAFFKQNAKVGQWIDVMVRLTGANVAVLNSIHAWDWEAETSERQLPAPPELDAHTLHSIRDVVQVIPSGPGMPEAIIQQVLLQSIYLAQEKITITTPYFVPSENLMFAIISAAQRGVDVDIIIPDRNDSLMVEWASRSFFGELLRAGVKLHRFRDGLLHTKSVVIDNRHSLIGTVNLDMRSLWLNFEVTLAVENKAFTESLIALQQSYLQDSVAIDADSWNKRKFHKRFAEQFFYWFSPLL